jgi:hypothetical protein
VPEASKLERFSEGGSIFNLALHLSLPSH